MKEKGLQYTKSSYKPTKDGTIENRKDSFQNMRPKLCLAWGPRAAASKVRKMAREIRWEQAMVTGPQWQKASKTNENQFTESGVVAAAELLQPTLPTEPTGPSSQKAQPLSDL